MLKDAPMECSPVERNVLLLMAGFADPEGTKIIQSYDSISEVVGFSKSAVRVAVDFWLGSKILILVKPGGGRGHAPEYAIDLTTIQNFISDKGAVEKHLYGNGKVPPEATKGATKVQKGAVERHPPSLPKETHTENHQRSADDFSNGDRLDDFKKKVLAKCKDPNGQLATALDVIVERVMRAGVPITSPNYLEAALQRFDFQRGQDREDWMVASKGRIGER
jgi:hypothetical protein